MAEGRKEQKKLRETTWHVREADDVASELDTDPAEGLSTSDAKQRLERFGPNRIRSREALSWWNILLRQVADPLIYILLIAAAVSIIFAHYFDAIVILSVVVINGIIGFVQEFRARKAIQSLAAMTAPMAHVIRDGREQEIPTEEVVPGDIITLAAGVRVPADARLFRSDDLQADEAALTGESHPVSKQEDPVADEQAVAGDQFSMVFSGTSITRGRGRGVVVRVGDASELGDIARETQEMEEVETPIQQKVNWLAKAIGLGILGLSLVILIGGLLMGMALVDIARTAVSLAVGGVPEALPIVLTVTLARGVRRMAKRNAIIRSLPAVETLGSTTVVGSDKTGTLTTNEMTVKVIWTGQQRFDVGGSGYDIDGDIRAAEADSDGEIPEAVRQTVLAGLLANEAKGLPEESGGEQAKKEGNRETEEGDGQGNQEHGNEAEKGGGQEGDDRGGGGDPTELALLVSAAKAGFELSATREEYRQSDIIPFESDRQFMATLNETPEGRCIFLKGSPEAVLSRCTRQLAPGGEESDLDAEAAREMAGKLADEGYRVLGMALKYQDLEAFEGEDPGSDLVFAGFQAMEDPVRPEAVEAVEAAHHAGIRVIMLTGDHARTARAIGDQLGLGDGDPRVEEGRSLEERSEEELDRLTRRVNVFARVSPDHKLKLVERLKEQGQIVAVTGDGVNDAPALQAAHLGVAMGKSGTDVAREASDMVLADDNFASITNAVEEGRIVFSNIRKVTYFLLSTGVGIVLVILSSIFGPWALPFVPVQVLWINLVTNGLQDLALAFEKGEPGLLEEPPRDPREGVLNRPVLWRLGWFALLIAVGTLGVFWWMLRQDVSLELARTVAMTQVVLFQFFHVLNARSFHRSIFKIPVRANPFLAGALAIAVLAHLAGLHLPFMQALLETEPLGLEHWGLVLAVGSLIVVAAEIDKALLRRRDGREDTDDDTGPRKRKGDDMAKGKREKEKRSENDREQKERWERDDETDRKDDTEDEQQRDRQKAASGDRDAGRTDRKPAAQDRDEAGEAGDRKEKETERSRVPQAGFGFTPFTARKAAPRVVLPRRPRSRVRNPLRSYVPGV